MTLTYFCDIDKHLKENFRKAISEIITATATLSCTVIIMQHGIVLERTWHMWPWPLHKGSKRLDLLFGFPVPVCRWLDLERSYLEGWWMWGSRRSLCFLPDLDLLLRLWYTVMRQIQNYPYLKSYNDNRETTMQTRTFWGVVGVFAHKYYNDLVKFGGSALAFGYLFWQA